METHTARSALMRLLPLALVLAAVLAGPSAADTVVTLGDRPTVVAFVGAGFSAAPAAAPPDCSR